MRRFFLVLKFEMMSMLQKKSFLISTVLVAAGSFLLMSLTARFMNDDEVTAPTKDKTMIIYDGAAILHDEQLIEQGFPDYEITFSTAASDMKDQVQNGTADAGFEILNATSFTYYVNNSSLNDTTADRFSKILQKQLQNTELQKLNYDVTVIDSILETPITAEQVVLGTDGMNNYFYTYILIMILYIMILVYGNQIGVGVASEKSNRAIEILTTSCSPYALIFGKVIAGAAVGAVQTLLMLGSFLLSYQLNADQLHHMLDPFLDIPASVLGTFALFGIMGYLLFSFLFGAIGAMCSKVEEVNGATMPIQMLIIAVFILSFVTLQSPDTLLAKVAMYVPFTSWMCMFVNVAVGTVTTAEILISFTILVVTTAAMGLLGARLYRRGTLTYGNSIKLKHMLKMLRQQD